MAVAFCFVCFEESPYHFSWLRFRFPFPPASHEGSNVSPSSPTLAIFWGFLLVLTVATLMDMRSYLIVGLILPVILMMLITVTLSCYIRLSFVLFFMVQRWAYFTLKLYHPWWPNQLAANGPPSSKRDILLPSHEDLKILSEYCPHEVAKETDTQRSELLCPRSHS